MCNACDTATEDTKLGCDWVYCYSHVGVHTVGWCTASMTRKIALKAKNYEDAIAEARAKGLQTYYN